jgi:hypothetical protein
MCVLGCVVSSWRVPERRVVLQDVIDAHWLVAWDREVRERSSSILLGLRERNGE